MSYWWRRRESKNIEPTSRRDRKYRRPLFSQSTIIENRGRGYSRTAKRKTGLRSITSELPVTRADQETLSNVARGLSNQPSGFHLAIWRMRLRFLSSILSLQFRKGVFARHGQFNNRNDFKRICVCRGEGEQQCGCRSRPTLDAN